MDCSNCPPPVLNNVCTFGDRQGNTWQNPDFWDWVVDHKSSCPSDNYQTNGYINMYYLPYTFVSNDQMGVNPDVFCNNLGNGEWYYDQGFPCNGNYMLGTGQGKCIFFSGKNISGYSINELNSNPIMNDCLLTRDFSWQPIRCRPNSSYLGDPKICCLQNMFCSVDDVNSKLQVVQTNNLYNPLCFDTSGLNYKSSTCDPKYRRLGGSDCYTSLFTWCTTNDPNNGPTIAQKWSANVTLVGKGGIDYVTNSPCTRLFFSTFYSDNYSPTKDSANPGLGHECYADYTYYITQTGGVADPTDYEGPRKAQALITAAINNHVAAGGNLTGQTGAIGVNTSFNELIYNICKNYPGSCQQALSQYCLPITEQQLKTQPEVLNFCGCYLSQSVYSLYTNTFQINQECTPYCNLDGTIPMPLGFNQRGGKQCQQSTCVINDISLNFVNSQVTGGITIGNFCGNCSTGTCSCLLNDITFTSINSQIANVNMSQECGTNSTCVSSLPGDKSQNIKIPCNDTVINGLDSALVKPKALFIAILIIIGIIILVVLLFYLIGWFFGVKTTIPGNPTMTIYPDLLFEPKRGYTSLSKVF